MILKRMTLVAAALAASLTALAIPSLTWAHSANPPSGPFATINATLSQLTSEMQHAMADIQTLATTQSRHATEITQNTQTLTSLSLSLENEATQVTTLQQTVNAQGQKISTLESNVTSLSQEVQSLSQQVQSLTAAPPQTSAPTLVSAAATSPTSITLTFNAPVAATDSGSPLNGQFLVTLNGLSMSPGNVTVNGDTVLIAMPTNYSISAGDTVSVTYSAGANGSTPVGLESQTGVGTASFTQSVTTTALGTPSSAPTIASAVVSSPTAITLTFTVPVAATDPGSPLNGQFLVTLNGLSMSPGSVTVNGDTVLVTTPINYTISAGESVSVHYSAGLSGSSPVGLESVSGVGVSSFTASVTNDL